MDLPREEGLPESLPADPMPLARAWLDEAMERASTPNPNAMALATVDAQGEPDVRMVLCKDLDPEAGHLVFFTNYDSAKARAIEATGRAAVVLHFDDVEQQIRVRGPVVRSPASESDAYFATRHPVSQLGAWASHQSAPIDSRAELLARVERVIDELGVGPGVLMGEGESPIPRPPFWGGHRLIAQRVELWVGEAGRIHDRAVWTRTLTPRDEHSMAGGPWEATRLQP